MLQAPIGLAVKIPVRAPAAVSTLLAGVCVILVSGCANEPPTGVTLINSAVALRADGSELAAVQLPDQRTKASAAAYRFTLPALSQTERQRGLGVFITVSDVPVAAFVNGAPVFQNGDANSSPIQISSWRASPMFRIAPSLLVPHRNELVVYVNDRPRAFNVLGPVYVGEPAALERWVIRDGMMRHLAPLLIGAVLLGVGLIALSLWRGRRDSTLFLLLAAGTILWGFQSIMLQLPSPLLPRPHQSVLTISLYVWFPMLLSVFFVRFAYVHWRPYELGALVLAIIAVPAMYAGWQFDQQGLVSTVMRAITLVWISIALAAIMRYAWRERTIKSTWLLAAGAVCVGFAIRDWIVSMQAGNFRVIYLTGYSGLALILLAGWMLIDRYHRAYATTEAINRELEKRVKLANAQLERQLAQVQDARDRAEQASRAKSRFFAAASHDLRQPLHSLGFFAAALQRHAGSPEASDLVGRIGDSVSALDGLFNELLDLSKLDAGAIEVRRLDVPLQPLFDRLSLAFHAEAVERELRMRFVPTQLAVRTDPVLLERILTNLVSNALRYTRQGGVVIGARRRSDLVALEVCDSGIGIAADQQSQIFDEFYQVGNPGRDRRRGLGLGLAIVRRLTDLLGHRLILVSNAGRGTRFQLLLPRAYLDAERPAGEEEYPVHGDFTGRRIMLIDDDPDIRLATRTLLNQWGVDVRSAAGVSEAEALIDSGFHPELAIVDLRLDGMDDGVDLVERLRMRFGARLPALLISGDTGARELGRVRASGVPLLTKPVSAAQLRSALLACFAA